MTDVEGCEDAVRVDSKGKARPLPRLLETSPRLRAPGSYILLSRMRLLSFCARPALPDSIATHARFLQTGIWQALQGGEGLTQGFWPWNPPCTSADSWGWRPEPQHGYSSSFGPGPTVRAPPFVSVQAEPGGSHSRQQGPG